MTELTERNFLNNQGADQQVSWKLQRRSAFSLSQVNLGISEREVVGSSAQVGKDKLQTRLRAKEEY